MKFNLESYYTVSHDIKIISFHYFLRKEIRLNLPKKQNQVGIEDLWLLADDGEYSPQCYACELVLLVHSYTNTEY